MPLDFNVPVLNKKSGDLPRSFCGEDNDFLMMLRARFEVLFSERLAVTGFHLIGCS